MPRPKRKAAAKETTPELEEVEDKIQEQVQEKAPAVKKRKTKGAKPEDATPLASRTDVSSLNKTMFIGAHVSGAGGVHNAIGNAINIGANSFALFLKSQRKWTSPALDKDVAAQFKTLSKEHGFDAAAHVLPHGSYLVNLAQVDPDKAKQAYDCFLDDLLRCEALGIKLYNFHPGSTGTETRASALTRIAEQLNKAHRATKTVITVIENMCGHGNIIGATWEDLRDIISQIDDKSRVGICIDTCHAFAAGHDLRTPEAFEKTMAEFDKVVGLKYLKALHLNDSKAPFDSARDLHANIGTGFLGLRAFHNVMNYEPFQNLPMVLETPIDEKSENGKSVENKQIWADEIKLLESLIGMDPETDSFKTQVAALQKKGQAEREKVQAQVDKAKTKGTKKPRTASKKGKKQETTDDEESE